MEYLFGNRKKLIHGTIWVNPENILCSVKEVSHKRPQILRSQLYDILGKAEYRERKQISGCQKQGGGKGLTARWYRNFGGNFLV